MKWISRRTLHEITPFVSYSQQKLWENIMVCAKYWSSSSQFLLSCLFFAFSALAFLSTMWDFLITNLFRLQLFIETVNINIFFSPLFFAFSALAFLSTMWDNLISDLIKLRIFKQKYSNGITAPFPLCSWPIIIIMYIGGNDKKCTSVT